MKVIRTEEGKYYRTITLDIDEVLVESINRNIEMYLEEGEDFICLTVDEVWKILRSAEAPRFDEWHYVKLFYFEGNMKLGNFVRMMVNDALAQLPGKIDDEVVDLYYDTYTD